MNHNMKMNIDDEGDQPAANKYKLEAELKQKNKEIAELKQLNSELEARIEEQDNILSQIFSSDSWKLTKPLRVIGRYFKGFLGINKANNFLSLKNIKKTLLYCKKYGIKKTYYRIKYVFWNYKNYNYNHDAAYQEWIKNNENYNLQEVLADIDSFSYKPVISIIMPVYNVEEKWLRKCIDSVRGQYYDNWELCIADDNSTEKHVRPVLKEYMAEDDRIKVVFREENGHISRASNSALELAEGEFIALLDNDDKLPPFALYELVKLLNKHPDADLIYSDEDKIDENEKRSDPHFKADWSPDTLLSCNYITHLGVYRKSIIDDIGGFRVGYEGSQDYDLVLRFSEQTDNIYHIPKILYHWRMIAGSTAVDISGKNYAYEAGYRVLQDTVKRRGYDAEVLYTEGLPLYNLRFNCQEENFISIIIPSRDKADILENCLQSIYNKSNFTRFEVIIVDNGSVEAKTFALLRKYKNKYDNLRVLRLDIPFNFSRLNNEAVKIAEGDLLLFLNNDIEVINPDWLGIMAGQAARKNTGAVGARLLYPSNRIQHAGVVLGLGGVAAHAYKMAHRKDAGYIGRLQVNYNYSAVTGACLMVEKKKFNSVNGFEEKLSVAYNDVDLCLKLMDKGYYNLHLPEVELYHHESISRQGDNIKDSKRFNNEIRYMQEKWEELLANDPFYNPNLTLANPHFHIDPYCLHRNNCRKAAVPGVNK